MSFPWPANNTPLTLLVGYKSNTEFENQIGATYCVGFLAVPFVSFFGKHCLKNPALNVLQGLSLYSLDMEGLRLEMEVNMSCPKALIIIMLANNVWQKHK